MKELFEIYESSGLIEIVEIINVIYGLSVIGAIIAPNALNVGIAIVVSVLMLIYNLGMLILKIFNR